MAMTTFARGVPATKRAVGAFTNFKRSVMDQTANVNATWDVRSATTADEAERRAIQHEHEWIDRAALAAMRMVPRG